MSNRSVFLNNELKKEGLRFSFTMAINCEDVRTQRENISECLRLATIRGVDGMKLLFDALKEKYEPLAQELPKKARAVVSQSADGQMLDGQYVCPNCKVDFETQKAFSGHGPTRCASKRLVMA